jgi:hypothetical protein
MPATMPGAERPYSTSAGTPSTVAETAATKTFSPEPFAGVIAPVRPAGVVRPSPAM